MKLFLAHAENGPASRVWPAPARGKVRHTGAHALFETLGNHKYGKGLLRSDILGLTPCLKRKLFALVLGIGAGSDILGLTPCLKHDM